MNSTPSIRVVIALADYPPGQCARAIRLLEEDEAAGNEPRSAEQYLAAVYIDDSPYDVAWRSARRDQQ